MCAVQDLLSPEVLASCAPPDSTLAQQLDALDKEHKRLCSQTCCQPVVQRTLSVHVEPAPLQHLDTEASSVSPCGSYVMVIWQLQYLASRHSRSTAAVHQLGEAIDSWALELPSAAAHSVCSTGWSSTGNWCACVTEPASRREPRPDDLVELHAYVCNLQQGQWAPVQQVPVPGWVPGLCWGSAYFSADSTRVAALAACPPTCVILLFSVRGDSSAVISVPGVHSFEWCLPPISSSLVLLGAAGLSHLDSDPVFANAAVPPLHWVSVTHPYQPGRVHGSPALGLSPSDGSVWVAQEVAGGDVAVTAHTLVSFDQQSVTYLSAEASSSSDSSFSDDSEHSTTHREKLEVLGVQVSRLAVAVSVRSDDYGVLQVALFRRTGSLNLNRDWIWVAEAPQVSFSPGGWLLAAAQGDVVVLWEVMALRRLARISGSSIDSGWESSSIVNSFRELRWSCAVYGQACCTMYLESESDVEEGQQGSLVCKVVQF